MMKVPTQLQIASRQVFPKQLPAFSGCPEDWPLFISAYEQANLSCGFTNAENLVRLQEALKGKALDLVRNRLLLPDNVPTIIEKLRRRFGNPEILSTLLAHRIQKLEGSDSENLESVIEFGSAVEEFTQHLEVSKLIDHLKNPMLMQSLIQTLPSSYAMQWVEYKRRSQVVDLKTFGRFMEELVDKALEVTFERMDGLSSKKREKPKAKGFVYSTEEAQRSCHCKSDQHYRKFPDEPPKHVPDRRPLTSQVQISPKKEISCSICQKPGHIGRDCREFRNKSLEDRWRIVKRRELCPLCLYNHGNSQCRSKIRCDDEDCNEQHHPLLHPAVSEGTSRTEARCNSHRLPNKTVMFRIVPVTLYYDGKEAEALALVDEGSSISLIDNEVAELLGVDGPCEPLKMCWTNGVNRIEAHSKKVDVLISGRNQSKKFDLRAGRTVSKLDLPAQQLDSRQFIEEFHHLKDIEIPSYALQAPKILIGIDNIHLIAPLESRVGETGEPIAVRCPLGWTVYGPRPNVVTNVHFLGHHHCSCEERSQTDRDLNQMMRDSFQLEAVGVSPIRLESKEDQRARELVELSTKRVGLRFETCLPWKKDEPRFPDSYRMALKRLINLEVRMDRNPGVRDILQKQIEEYIAKGYAHKATDRELLETPEKLTWYLPLNFIINPKKPGKFRMVWDAAAKSNGVSLNDTLLTGRWFRGPDFLYQMEECWPKQKHQSVEVEEELRASVLLHEIILPDVMMSRMEHISKWKVLVRTVATMYRFISNCRQRIQKQAIEALPSRETSVKLLAVILPLRQEEYLAAENYLWRVAQAEEFADEVKTLLKNDELPQDQKKPIEKSSLLYRLSPFLDEFGVVRMEGRTEAAEYAAFDVRFPIILPKNHLVTIKLLEAYHHECGHGSRETVVNEIRQRFYIPGLRSRIDRVMRDCLWCKIQKSKPLVPRMAPLPRPRMAAKLHPFSFVGLDYFGPLEVAIGRRREKRWVALFTCLTVRAVHLEVVHNLTTQSCEMAIRRFVKRYGSPIEIFSDNGTNFVGASRDLIEQVRKINTECADTFTGAKTKWTFNPPSAPHMGGVWERMVRSVKEALKTFTGGERLTDEILQTALVEAESLINARPLTYVSTNVQEDTEALTPNHFLRNYPLGECMPSRQPEELADRLRSSYRQAQYLAGEVWSRWQREYLPTMNRRTKWFEEQKPIAVGDLVYVADTEKRNSWERGVVEEIFTGGDGRVRLLHRLFQ